MLVRKDQKKIEEQKKRPHLFIRRGLLLLILDILINRSILILLILGNQILHVGLGLGELHLVHALLGIPMQERLALEHGGELVGDALEEFLDGGGVADEGDGHLEACRRG